MLAQNLAATQQPALVIWGANDKIIPSAHAPVPGKARVEIIEGAGHMVQMEKANRVNELILAHVARQSHGSESV